MDVPRDNGWHDGGSVWFGRPMMLIAMAVFWGGLAWILVTMIRSSGPQPHEQPDGLAVEPPAPRPEQLLHDRLARGEISVDDYHERIEALRARSAE